jgi:hypothetical protein
MATTSVVGNLVCQAPLMLYDHFSLKYHLFIVQKESSCKQKVSELYHDRNLIKQGVPIGRFYKYTCDGKIDDLEVYGKSGLKRS